MNQGNGDHPGAKTNSPQVVDFEEARTKRLIDKRRRAERVFFKQMISVYCVKDQSQMKPIDIVDISEDGCAFQTDFDPQNPWPQTLTDLNIRMYFSQDTYLSVVLKVQNTRHVIDGGRRLVRYGCLVDRTLSSYPAYQQFVRFLSQYATHAHKDQGNASVFYL